MHRRQAHRVLDVRRDRLVRQLVHVVGLPVPLVPRRVQRVERALQRRVGHRRHAVECRAELARRRQVRGRLVGRAEVAPDDPAHLLQVQRGRERRRGRHGEEREEAVDGLRGAPYVPVEEAQDVARAVQGPQHRSGDHGVDRRRLEVHGGHDAEVAATAAEPPEQVGVLLLAGGDDRAVGQDDLGGAQVVDGEAAASREVPEAAAEREPGDAGGADDPAGHGEAERMRGVIELGQRRAALDAYAPRRRLHVDAVHRREVADDRVVRDAQPAGVVPPAAHREQHVAPSCEVDHRDDVGDVRTARDDRRATVDHPVVDRPRLVVAGVLGADQLAAECSCEHVVDESVRCRGHRHVRPPWLPCQAKRGGAAPVNT